MEGHVTYYSGVEISHYKKKKKLIIIMIIKMEEKCHFPIW